MGSREASCRLDGGATFDRVLLLLSSAILGGFQPVTQTDGDSASSLDSVGSKESSSCATS